MKATKNALVNLYLSRGAQGSFLSIANRNNVLTAGEYEFTCSEQVATLNKGKYTDSQGTVHETADAIVRIQLTGKPGFFLISTRALGLEPIDFAIEDGEDKSDKILMKWPACKGSVTLTLVTKNRDGSERPTDKQYYRTDVSLKN